MDAPAISATPAPRTAHGKMRSRGSRFCTAESPTTPMATPVPSPVNSNENAAGPPWRTFEAMVGPNGTTMPPPIRPVPSPTSTARTTGVLPMKRHPSLRSVNALPRLMPSSLCRPCALGIASVEISVADTKNVSTSA